VARLFRDLTTQPGPSLLNVASSGGARLYSTTGFGCKLIVAFSSLEHDFFRNFTTSQKVVVVICDLPASVAAFNEHGLILKLTLNGGASSA
jgi:hypothetical protein